MRSEERLHPLSILFGFGSQLRAFALPGIAVLLTAGAAGLTWQLWLLLLLIPYAAGSLLHYLTFRYRCEAAEMVIQSGVVVRNQRHVPYERIHNLDAVQNVFHRLFGVVEVRIETGGGKEPEAILRVVPQAAFDALRSRVLAARRGAGAEPAASSPAAAAAPAGETLLELSPRELLLCGLLENRGWVLLGAALGVAWELDAFDAAGGWLWGGAAGRDAVRGATRALADFGGLPLQRLGTTAVVLVLGLLALQLASMLWALVRLHGFRLRREGDDLRAEHGLLTRVATAVPLGRIQTLTIRQGPLQRLAGRLAVRVETAGSAGEGAAAKRRENLAPILRRQDLAPFLRRIMPQLDLAAARWQGVHPRAFRRAVKPWILLALALSLPVFVVWRWWGFAVLPPLLAFFVFCARRQIQHLRWAEADGVVLFASGWLWRRITAVPWAKIQAVAVHQSPFDRRAAMARVRIDTAGAGELSHRVDVPYLPAAAARRAAARLAAQAARTAFRW